MSSAPERPAKSEPRPSASVLLVSPTNNLLLLHRVQTSSSFASAHVFPGGNLSLKQDGPVPGATDPQRHRDGAVYRHGAIRECFEECGILLATDKSGKLLEVPDDIREAGRQAVHANQITFPDWVREQGGELDTDGLIPFTRWVTPSNIPKRFTTQMYLYFLPLSASNGNIAGLSSGTDAMIPAPSHDGGKEHTAARFRPVHEWLAHSRAGEIILFPPQFFLMWLLAQFFAPGTADNAALQRQRDQVRQFVQTSSPPWTDKCISPLLLLKLDDGRQVLSLEKPGPELEGSDRSGETEHTVVVKFMKEGPRKVEVLMRTEAFDLARKQRRAAKKGISL